MNATPASGNPGDQGEPGTGTAPVTTGDAGAPSVESSGAPSEVRGGTSAFDLPLGPLRAADPWRWLAAGWMDFRRAPAIGLFYGACFVLMGWALAWVFQAAPAYTLALSAGFLLTGPFLCLGLYHVSRALERGQRPDLGASLLAWETRMGTMAIFAGGLLILEMLWARASLIVFAVSFDTMPDFQGSLLALLNPEHLGFILTYLAVGGVFAGLIFCFAVVAIPMILDRGTDAISAALCSFRVCLNAPGVMLCWGALIVVLVVLAMLPGFAGLLLAGPVIGHASWHAYRAALPRQAGEADPTPTEQDA